MKVRSRVGAASLLAFVSFAPMARAQEPAAAGRPVKFQVGVEYSVVSEDLYGDQAKLVLEVIPVIPNLIRRSVLGGN